MYLVLHSWYSTNSIVIIPFFLHSYKPFSWYLTLDISWYLTLDIPQSQLVDVTLMCDGGSFPAHRLVLAACSPYFSTLFSTLDTPHPIIFLKDVRQAELVALLEFIYRGQVSYKYGIYRHRVSFCLPILEFLTFSFWA